MPARNWACHRATCFNHLYKEVYPTGQPVCCMSVGASKQSSSVSSVEELGP